MTPPRDTSQLSIGAISEATDIPTATLRTWERRYGFPNPDRTAAGHRRFSPDIVERLRLTARAVDAGHQASDVVGLPENELRELLGESDPAPAPPAPDPSDADRELDPWLTRWLEASADLDGESLEREFRREWNRLGALEFVQDRATPYLRQLGSAWANGEMSVAEEHYASEQIRDFLSNKWRSMADRAEGPRTLFVAPEGEHHALGLHLAAVVFGLAGWRIVFLGPNTPADEVTKLCCERDIGAVAATIASSYDLDQATAYFDELDRNCPSDIELIGGGYDLPDAPDRVKYFDSLDDLYDWASDAHHAQTGTD
jgi:DNA-binding transcriptional MerR regulator/methylmalonyl-CoA mutase cobalamin-binding subunit